MKKFMIALIFALAATAFVVAPASADIKFTSKGYMQIQGMYLSAYPIKVPGNEGSNNWYNMEMILQPTVPAGGGKRAEHTFGTGRRIPIETRFPAVQGRHSRLPRR